MSQQPAVVQRRDHPWWGEIPAGDNENPFGVQRDNYKFTVSAEALLVNIRGTKGLRVESQSLGLEFTDGSYLGTDPEGILSYDKYNDFQIDQWTSYYTVTTFTREHAGKTKVYLRIPFYHGVGKPEYNDPYYKNKFVKPFAVFLAEDKYNTVAANQLEGYSALGEWIKLVLGSATAVVRKGRLDDTVTLTAEPVNKLGTWSVGGSSLVPRELNVPGILYYRNVNCIDEGKYVNYNNDRLIFYQDQNSTDFTAYFIPFDPIDEKNDLGIARDTEFAPVSWATSKFSGNCHGHLATRPNA